MLVALEKLRTNIVEYLLYMFHIEDLIRAHHCNMEELEIKILPGYKLQPEQLDRVRNWYRGLIEQMEKDDVIVSGHITSLKEMMFKLNDTHIELLNKSDEEQYLELYKWAADAIRELKIKMKQEDLTEVEVCLNGLYGYMLMKMKKQEVTPETAQAMAVFSQLMRYLSRKYNERVVK